MRKYRGKYTNARDCLHAETTEHLMASVKVRESCPNYKPNLELVPTAICQYHCQYYEKGEKGMRVLAVRDADENEVNIFGYGEYVGDEPCPLMGGARNPKIVLDSGEVVWGCQCWWGAAEKAEEKLKLQTGGRTINTVPVRREASEE